MRHAVSAGPRPVRPIVAAQLVSVTGTQVSALGLPTIAVLVLHARPLAVSLLFAVSYAAQAASAPLAGLLVDSIASLRLLLITADLLQALVVISVPVSRMFSLLSLPFLFVVAVATGGLGGVTSIAIRAAVARSVPREGAVAASSALTGARTVGQLTGPALAGWLIQALGAVTAVAADAVSYLASALICLRLPATSPSPSGPATRRRPSLRVGLTVLRGRPALVRIVIAGAALNLGGAALGALYVLYAYRVLRLTPAELGTLTVIENCAAIGGVLTAARVSRQVGLERLVPVLAPLAAAALFLIPAASWLPPLAALACYGLVFGWCSTVWAIGSASLQQILVPPGQIGRVTALSGSISLAAIPTGAIAGGILASVWGLRPTLLLAAAVALTGTLTVAARAATWRFEPSVPVRAGRH